MNNVYVTISLISPIKKENEAAVVEAIVASFPGKIGKYQRETSPEGENQLFLMIQEQGFLTPKQHDYLSEHINVLSYSSTHSTYIYQEFGAKLGVDPIMLQFFCEEVAHAEPQIILDSNEQRRVAISTNRDRNELLLADFLPLLRLTQLNGREVPTQINISYRDLPVLFYAWMEYSIQEQFRKDQE